MDEFLVTVDSVGIEGHQFGSRMDRRRTVWSRLAVDETRLSANFKDPIETTTTRRKLDSFSSDKNSYQLLCASGYERRECCNFSVNIVRSKSML
jgi:hypothetical protein